jgi:hypothetical protein
MVVDGGLEVELCADRVGIGKRQDLGRPEPADPVLPIDPPLVSAHVDTPVCAAAIVPCSGGLWRLTSSHGARTQAAIRRFQASIDAEATGLQPLTDQRIGFRLNYPGALLTKEDPADGSYRLLSDGRGRARLEVVDIESRDLRTVFDDLTRHLEDGYQPFDRNWFVVSGEVDGDMFYSMGRRSGGRTVIAHLTYPASERKLWDPFSVFLYNSFELTEAG